ncbi:unnamed protein product [Withania somnifera]
MSSTGKLTCTYACSIPCDDDIPISAERIDTLIKASNLNVESYWPSLFAKLCQNVEEPVMNDVAGGTATSTNVAAAPPTDNDEEIKEESDDETMFRLFD